MEELIGKDNNGHSAMHSTNRHLISEETKSTING